MNSSQPYLASLTQGIEKLVAELQPGDDDGAMRADLLARLQNVASGVAPGSRYIYKYIDLDRYIDI